MRRLNWFWIVHVTGFGATMTIMGFYIEGLSFVPFVIVPGLLLFGCAMPVYALVRKIRYHPFLDEPTIK